MNPLINFPHLDITATEAAVAARKTGDAKGDRNEEVRRVAREFEAILLAQMTAALKPERNEEGDALFGGGESDLAQQLFAEQLAISMAESGGIGLADLIAHQLGDDSGEDTTTHSPLKGIIETVRTLRGASTQPAGIETAPASVSAETAELMNMVRPRRVSDLRVADPATAPGQWSGVSGQWSESEASIEALKQMTRPRRVSDIPTGEPNPRLNSVPLPPEPAADAIQFAAAERPQSGTKLSYTGKPGIDAIIEQASARFGLDPSLVAAVLQTESSGRQHSVSHKGASGYMQLMPATFRQFAGPGKDIFDPRENINVGAAYLKFLSDRFGGRLDKVLAAYNAGEGNVERFGGIPPFRETRNFVASVKKRYEELLTASAAGDSTAADRAAPKLDEAQVIINPVRQARDAVRVVPAGGDVRSSDGDAVELQIPVQGRISSQFGARRAHGRHKGVDIAVARGTPIEASAAGEVVFAGWKRGYGKTVVIRHQDGLYTRYAHADKILVSRGDKIESGQPVATVGSTGRATGPHLHFEVISEGRAVNPLHVVRDHLGEISKK